jgi:hypothetical protein
MMRMLSLVVSLALAGEPEPIKAVNLEKLNTAADEDDPFASDSQTFFYAVKPANGTYDIHMSRRSAANAAWPAGKPVPALASKDADERSPFVFKQTLYFATNAIPDEKLKDRKNFDIKQRTGERAALPLIGISEAEDELHPWVTAGGREFYFSRKEDKGWILMRAEGPVPGPIGKAKAVGFPPDFHHATISATGLTMFLQGPLDDDRTGIFRIKRAKVGASWSKPEPLNPLNDPKALRGDMSPSLSLDGSRLYFVSDRPGGKGGLDIWYVLISQIK